MATPKKPGTGSQRPARVSLADARSARKTKPGVADAITPEQYRRAREGIGPMLGGKFSAAWIARHSGEVLSRAHAEYVEWLADNPPADNPVGWILQCAYWRAQNLYDSERRKPATAPLDSIFHIADDSEPDPEQRAVESDRRRLLADALGHLPEKERKLLAYVYFGDLSIREAGRKLGWAKSAADRHHKAAMEKMLALVGDRKLLSNAILGPAAHAAVTGEGHRALYAFTDAALLPARYVAAVGTEAAEIGANRIAELARRLVPFSDAGNAMATGGAGRVVAQCGAAAGIAACSLLAGPAVEQGVENVLPDRPARSSPPRRSRLPRPQPAPAVPIPDHSAQSQQQQREGANQARAERRQRRQEARAAEAPPPPAGQGGQPTGGEFGDNNFEPGSSEAEAPATEPAPAPPPPAGQGGQPSGGEFGL